MAIPQIKNSVQPLDVISTVNDVVDNKGVDQTYNASSSNAQSGTAVAEAISDLVPNTVTINGKALDGDITLTASDVSALSSDTEIPLVDQTYSSSSTNAQSGTAVAGAISNLVPNSRKVNGKALSSDITLTASDVSALPANTAIPVVDQTYSASSTNAQSGTAVASAISNKQDTLVSGTNIKTINNASILGEGNIEISGGGDVDQTYNPSSTNAQSGTAIAGAGFKTTITSSDVTTALGYTPYNSSNPAGYTNNTGTVTSVNNIEPVDGNVTISIPSAQTVDQTYNASSTNAQSGTAVAGALSALNVPTLTDSVSADSTEALTSGGAYSNLVRRLSDTVATGSTSQGVYVDANGQIQACTAVTSSYTASGSAPVNGQAVASALSPITTVIPSAASASNQLADKEFVNSSISTNTATFRGTFESVEALEAYSGTKTNNDYAFVETTDSAGNSFYDRYKYNGTSWVFEYEINNTSFTSGQWSAINSGVTSSIVSLATTAMQPNETITAGTHTKITYDSRGLVTGGADLTLSDITTALGYTPYDSANPSNFITASDLSSSDITVALGYTPYSSANPDGFISSITSGDVTTALGYTPYSSANPDGFISSITSGDVTTALGYTPYNSTNPDGFITSSDVGDGSIVFMQGSVNKGTITANQTTDVTISLDEAGTSITVDTVMSSTSTNPVQNKVITAALDSYVPTSRTVNGKALSADITLTASDVSALPSTTSISDLLTTAQENAINSGIDSTLVAQIGTNTSDITTNTSAISANTSAIATNTSAISANTSAIATNTSNIATNTSAIAINTSAIASLTTQIPSASTIAQIGTNATNIANITTLIPSEASSSNKLADKAFVNSSVASNTANFIGTFDSVAELEAYSGTLTNNDYAFVATEDASGNTLYDRYKYTTGTNPASWVFEYELNNSSFTAGQWEAINSGVTTTVVSLATSAMQPNTAIVGGTHAKITYDSRGLVTGGADLTVTDITTALGYTPYDSTNPDGFISSISSSDVTTALGFTPYDSTNPDGFISSISSSDVTTALGYTPYSSANPDGFITSISSGDVTTALGYTPYSSANPNNYIAASDLTVTDITTALGYTPYNATNPDGFITSTAVGNGTIVFTQGGTSKGTITVNQTTDATIALDAGGGTGTIDTSLDTESTNPVENSAIATAINEKSSVVFVDWSS